ncbi:unnamed protein product [Rotaria sordida]|uniref:Uncharacterized protein n=1 Tax=Rotaria sordida TaxID=392033 RepID=A0A814H3Z9_9BILA|nr:unnamed protein product [Rotaria sordida]
MDKYPTIHVSLGFGRKKRHSYVKRIRTNRQQRQKQHEPSIIHASSRVSPLDTSMKTPTNLLMTSSSGSAYNRLHSPYFISRDINTNTLYIADYNNNRVMSYASGASNGTLVIGGQGSGTNRTQLYYSVGIHFDSVSNSLLIANYGGQHIVRCTLDYSNWTLVAGTPGMVGSSSTLLSYPTGVTLDPMAGQTNGTTIAGITGLSGSNSTQLYAPYSIRLDNQLNLLVADAMNHRIQKFLRY